MIDESLQKQIVNTLIALLIGGVLGVVYDIFRVVRLIGFKNRIIVFFEDIIFFLIATITMFSYYMQITYGKFRIYPLLFAIIGFFVYYKTIGKLVFFIIKKIYDLIVKVFYFIYKKTVLPLLNAIKKIFLPIFSFFKDKVGQNIIKFFKNLLPNTRKMLYNTRWNSKERKRQRKNAQRKNSKPKKAYFC